VKLVLARLKTAIYSDDEKGNTQKKEGAVKGNQTKWDRTGGRNTFILMVSVLFVFLSFSSFCRLDIWRVKLLFPQRTQLDWLVDRGYNHNS
jgi:hypothetical protein